MDFSFSLERTPYNENYEVGRFTRATTNFANFARDPSSNRQRIRTFLDLVNIELNLLLSSPESQRYAIELEILSIYINFGTAVSAGRVLLTETMSATVLDRQSDLILPGPTGLNFSSYLRDYDFRIVLPQLLKRDVHPQDWISFGKLHGMLARMQFGKKGLIKDPLAIAISIAQGHPYRVTDSKHPILGREYCSSSPSLTDRYFAKMDLHVSFFRPDCLPAPLAFYSSQQLRLQEDSYLAALIAVMANFQRIYRPEIYLSRNPFSLNPNELSQASLANSDHDEPALPYDRYEREDLSDFQARLIERTLIQPYGADLSEFFGLKMMQ